MEMQLPGREHFLDKMGKMITQSLFLEMGYKDSAVYTLKEDHYEYEGKILPSLKRLYLECEDPTEYEFASKYLLGWRHWKRLCDNRLLRPYIDEWREELEVKLRCRGVKAAIEQATKGGSFQAAKWVSDRGWEIRPPGRPSKEEVEREKKFQAKVVDEYGADIVRLYEAKG
jgi:hypothetical protein